MNVSAWLHIVPFIVALLVYCAASASVYRWLFARLLPFAKLLAGVFLSAQVLAIVVAEATQPHMGYAFWLWHLDLNGNVTATLASIQLSLVAATSFAVVWVAERRSAWQRLVFLIVGLVYLFAAADEFFEIHEWSPHWKLMYTAVGVGTAIATLSLALRSSRRARVWFSCLWIGMALSGFGAIVLDVYSTDCRAWGYITAFGECLKINVLEESFEFLGIWLVLVALLGLLSALSPSRRVRSWMYAWIVLWLTALILGNPFEYIEYRKPYVDANVEFEKDLRLYAYNVERIEKHSRLHVHVHLSPGELNFQDLGYSISLVDQARI